jgi:hypothetical protein
MTQDEGRDALHERRVRLVGRYDAAADDEKARLEAEIDEIGRRLNRIALDEGRAARERAGEALGAARPKRRPGPA